LRRAQSCTSIRRTSGAIPSVATPSSTQRRTALAHPSGTTLSRRGELPRAAPWVAPLARVPRRRDHAELLPHAQLVVLLPRLGDQPVQQVEPAGVPHVLDEAADHLLVLLGGHGPSLPQ